MSCNTNLFEQMAIIGTRVMCGLSYNGVLPWSATEVDLVSEVSPNADETVGYLGQIQQVKTRITPPPKVIIRDQFRNINNVVTKVGDAKFDYLSKTNYTKQQLEAADYWIINGEQFNLVPGTVVDDPVSVFWSGVLDRVRTNTPPEQI